MQLGEQEVRRTLHLRSTCGEQGGRGTPTNRLWTDACVLAREGQAHPPAGEGGGCRAERGG